MDWQKVLLYDMMAVDDDGLWVHSKFGLSVPRRNGKSEVDKMRELWGLFHGEHILHTAHRTTTKHSAWIFTNVPLAGEDRERRQGGRKKKISTHVPLAGYDASLELDNPPPPLISIHVPLAGDDYQQACISCMGQYFYPRPPCGGRPLPAGTTLRQFLFLSTSPLRGTTVVEVCEQIVTLISIHVPLAGDDVDKHHEGDELFHFYPRPPCGGRPASRWRQTARYYFYPRPPCGGRRKRPVSACS